MLRSLLVLLLLPALLAAAVPTTNVTGSLNLPSGASPTNVSITLTPSQAFSVSDASGIKYQITTVPQVFSIPNAAVVSINVIPNTGSSNSPNLTTYRVKIKAGTYTDETMTWQVPTNSLGVNLADLPVSAPVAAAYSYLQLIGGVMQGKLTLASTSTLPGLRWPVTTEPVGAAAGDTYINATDFLLYIYTGSVWQSVISITYGATAAALAATQTPGVATTVSRSDHAHPGPTAKESNTAGGAAATFSFWQDHFDVTPASGVAPIYLATGAVTPSSLAAGAVTLAKQADLAQNTLIGRATASTGVPEAVTLASTLAMSGGALGVPSGGIGPTELASTAVTPASYTNTSLTVDADGRITAASNGSASGVTVNVTGTGYSATTIRHNGPYTGSIVTGTTMDVTLTSALAPPRNLVVTRTGANTVLVTADEITLADANNGIVVVRSFSATCDISTASPPVANGPDTGTCDDEGFKFIRAIWNGTTAALILSESATAPVMPAGYSHKSVVLTAAYNHSDNAFLNHTQCGRDVMWNYTNYDTVAAGGGAVKTGGVDTAFTAVDASKRIPVAISRKSILFFSLSADAGGARDLSLRETGASTQLLQAGYAVASQTQVLNTTVLVNSSGSFDYKVSNAAASVAISVSGYTITIW